MFDSQNGVFLFFVKFSLQSVEVNQFCVVIFLKQIVCCKFIFLLEFILFCYHSSFFPENVTYSSVVCCDANAYCAQKLCTIKSLILFVISFRLVMSLGTASAVLQPDGTRYYIKPTTLPPLKRLSRKMDLAFEDMHGPF
jgi:hypothetical protein